MLGNICGMRTLTIYALMLTGCCCGMDKATSGPAPASEGKTTAVSTSAT